MGFLKPSVPSGPSPDDIRKREESAREKERERIRLADEQKKSSDREKATAALADKEQSRKRFAGQLASAEQDTGGRKRFLKAV